jgi:hypothetical protein
MTGDAKAKMRLAVTRACVNFPQLNMGPIHLAFYQVYADVAYFLGNTFVLQDIGMADEILGFLVKAQNELLNKQGNTRVVMGMTQKEVKKIRGLTLGMTDEMARVMLNYARENPGSSTVQVRRNTILTTRWNILANEWVDAAIEAALARFMNADRGQP